MTRRFDFTWMGFALLTPFAARSHTCAPYCVQDFSLAVFSAANSAFIVAAKHGLRE